MISLLNAEDADGFRVYFAKVPSPEKSNSDYKNTIVVVATFNGGPIYKDSKSNIHRDYFENNIPYLNSSNISDVNGVPHYDTDHGGATLFTHPNCGPNDCITTNPHYVTCKQAQNMVTGFVNDSPNNDINGSSEWFDIGILNDLDTALMQTPNSGLRVYFVKRIYNDADSNGNFYHGFLMIPTKNINGVITDDYICLQIHPHYKIKKMTGGGGGTDNGEQCPDNCTGVTWP
ncbi:MAG: hypothetical protein ACHQF4_10155 [Sphingobacteriales bacterium]